MFVYNEGNFGEYDFGEACERDERVGTTLVCEHDDVSSYGENGL